MPRFWYLVERMNYLQNIFDDKKNVYHKMLKHIFGNIYYKQFQLSLEKKWLKVGKT